MKKYLLFLFVMLSSVMAFSQTSFRSEADLKSFMQRRPVFKSNESSMEVTLNYTPSSGYFLELSSGKKLRIVDVSLNPSRPTAAMLGVEWLSEPAPLVIDLQNNKYMFLPPIPGEENISYDSNGRLRVGRTGRTNWMRLSMGWDGVQFTPCDDKPKPEYFNFVKFKN